LIYSYIIGGDVVLFVAITLAIMVAIESEKAITAVQVQQAKDAVRKEEINAIGVGLKELDEKIKADKEKAARRAKIDANRGLFYDPDDAKNK